MPKLPAANSMAWSRPSLIRFALQLPVLHRAGLAAVPTPAKHGWKPVSICDTAPVVGLVTKRLAPVSNE